MNRPARQMMIPQRDLVQAGELTTVADAARLMKDAEVGAILVMRKDRLVGIFTERDALNRVLAEGRDPLHTALIEVMTPLEQRELRAGMRERIAEVMR